VAKMEIRQPRNTEPRFFYGYIVVGVAFLVMVVSWGPYNVFGVFFNPLLTEFGWTSVMTSGAFSLSMILSAALGIVTGGLNDRFGPRLVVTLSGIFLGLGYLLMSQTSSLWHLYLFYGVIIGIGVSGTWVPLLSSVTRWFVKRRNLMTGIVVAGVGIGGLVAPPVISRLILTYGWRFSYAIQGIIILIVIVLGAQFFKRDPTQKGQLAYGENEEKQQELTSEAKAFSFKEAVCTTQFWLVSIIFFCYGYCVWSVLIHIVPHAIELEISAVTAANILASINGTSVLGNFALGSVGDRIGNKQIFIIGFIMMSAVLFCLMLAKEVWMLYTCAIVFGFALGGIAVTESPLIARLFGLSSHGLLFGIVGFSHIIGGAIGLVVTGYIFDLTHSYQMAFLVCAAFGVVNLILVALLRPTKRLEAKL
jgi:MFS family permease